MNAIRDLAGACAHFLSEYRRHPERDGLAARRASMAGRCRPHAAIWLSHLHDPRDTGPMPDDYALPPVEAPATPEGDLAREAVGMLDPLKLLNPIAPVFGLGSGPGTLVTAFGIPLNPEAQNAPAHTRPLADVLAEPRPDPETAGLMPALRERIERIRALAPPEFLIRLPDTQGPFNIAHSILGAEVFTAPYDDEPAFEGFMERVTTFYLGALRSLLSWIGPDRLAPENALPRVSECSVNLVSPDFYRRHILPHDRRIAAEFGDLHIHPCSGPHVFRVTFEGLPVVSTEAGYIERTAAGAISVEEASAVIRACGRPVGLEIGQEVPEAFDDAFESIRRDLDRYADNPRLMFAYTGMYWRRRHRPAIRELHRRLDAYWAERYSR